MLRWELDDIGRDRLALRSVGTPSPARGEVLVRVHAGALNHRDKMVIETGRGRSLRFPFTPASDLAGTVVALGDDVDRFAVGGAHLKAAVAVTAVGGHIHQIGALEGFEISAPAMPLMLKDITTHGIGTATAAHSRVIDTVYPMTDFNAALDHLDRGPFGKIVIDVT